jgi:hypothetical protein
MAVLHCSKNFQFLYVARLSIMNNILNCANIQFSIELELKILEKIQHLNF